MSILGNDLLLGSGDEGYNLTRSLRFRSSASAYLSRTMGTPTNNKIFTVSFWVKRGSLGSRQGLIGATNAGASFYWIMEFDAGNNLTIYDAYATGTTALTTTQVFRDPSAWYHVVAAVDTTQATASNRTKVYVNGSQVTSFSVSNYPSQNSNTYFNTSGAVASVGSWNPFSTPYYFDGYLTEINFIDGQALTPSSFGSTNTLTGVWQPARYTGTYGTNGFYLPFTDNSALTTSSNVGLGKDFSGNGNYWTTNNISITAGVTYDSMTDVPTLTSATAANFCIANPLDKQTDIAVAQGNLQISTTAGIGNKQIRGSIALPSSGKFYWETRNTGSANNFSMGITTTTASLSAEGAGDVLYNENGVINNNGTTTSGFATLALNDIVGVAVDVDANKIYFYKNNTLVNSGGTTINISAPFAPMFGLYDNGNAQSITFGQRPFSYTPPTGFVALNTYNLPTSTIVKGNTVMDATLFTGAGAAQSIVNAGGFKPDLVWEKNRSNVNSWLLYTSSLGVGKYLQTDTTGAEGTLASSLTSFDATGFSLGNAGGAVNATSNLFVAYQWQAGQGSSSSNTNGTITSTVSVNATAGFSVVTFSTSAGYTSGTIGHGLGVAPAMYIVKNRNGSSNINWITYHQSVGNTAALYLNATNAAVTSSTFWNNTSPTSSVFSVAGNLYPSSDMVAYCWTPIAGYSSFGSYTGNGSADGPMIYTGFRPKFVMIKGSSFVSNWFIEDSARNGYNVNDGVALRPNLSNAEDGTTTYNIDILSNGFKLRSSAGDSNSSGATFVYAAFAETPTKNALAR